ncbi:uncharacterized protein LOC127857028 [Dreissena polymorpha]|uniref:Protein sleepless n=1 Tax=Dreissena polymorpha TaxID=45954 RepID=A0A9D3Z207_DREPO|nr:uncharacterized protein LOC127857028 [Dreissena polymorpha]KAH3709180.1 hypothetical protein DPMN_068642 [Dreissena polymorpha]
MIGKKIFGIACVLAVLLCVPSVDAFKCYACIGTAECSDPFTKSTDLESTQTNCMACLKTKTNGVVVRACSSAALGSNKCEKANGVEACICESELCNGSINLAFSTTMLLGATLVVFLKV